MGFPMLKPGKTSSVSGKTRHYKKNLFEQSFFDHLKSNYLFIFPKVSQWAWARASKNSRYVNNVN